jgi:hypothetical protein
MFLYSANDVTSKCYYTSVISFLLNGFITLLRSGLCDKIFYGPLEQRKLKSKWLMHIKNIIMQNGFGLIWNTQTEINRKWFPIAFKQKLNDQYLQEWKDLASKSALI